MRVTPESDTLGVVVTDAEDTTPAPTVLAEWDTVEYTRLLAERRRNVHDSYEWMRLNNALATRFPERHRREGQRLSAAFKLATDLATCEALLRGELVPAERITPEYRHLLPTWASDSYSSQTTP